MRNQVDCFTGYLEWLKKKTLFTSDGKTQCVSTPFISPYNDSIQIFFNFLPDDRIRLSDGGNTASDLDTLGMKLSPGSRLEAYEKKLLQEFNTTLENDEIVRYASPEDIFVSQHMLLSSIFAIQELTHLSSYNYETKEAEKPQRLVHQIERLFIAHKINFSSDKSFVGSTGYQYKFDFDIPGKATIDAPEILNKDSATGLCWKKRDIEDRTGLTFPLNVITSENKSNSKGKAEDVLYNKGIKVLNWEDKEKWIEELEKPA
ncbi:MAG: DUF1828 domain-containing protein [Sphaerochaetaceae bacterium]